MTTTHPTVRALCWRCGVTIDDPYRHAVVEDRGWCCQRCADEVHRAGRKRLEDLKEAK